MMFTPVRLLLLLAAVLAAGLAGLWLDQQGHWRNITWAVPAAKAPDIKPPVGLLPELGNTIAPSFASIQERPLFAPDRRPPPPPPPPAPPDPLANIQIVGIYLANPSGILARVEGKNRRINVNELVGAWTLKSIDGRSVTFAHGTESRQLSLAYAPLGPRVAAVPSPAASPGGAGKPSPEPDPQNAFRQNTEDAARENLRRRNEIRAARGLPLITSN